MRAPEYRPLLSSGETVVIDLIELTSYEEIGGSAIVNYYVEMSVSGSAVWTSL